MESTKDAMNMSAIAPRDEAKIALFLDFDNIALGVRDAKYKSFEISKVLERLVEKGKIVYKKAYAAWEDYTKYKRPFHEAGIELVEVPRTSYSGKNSADIRLVVDAMDLCNSKEHINVFAIASGDSDFSPLVSKLKENNKYVIGIGVKNSTSDLLVESCDEFIFYEDLVREPVTPRSPKIDDLPKKQKEAFEKVLNAVQALVREDKEVIWGSMVKQTIKRKHPQFNEEYYGYRSFSHLLEDAQAHDLVTLKKDARSGSYIIVPKS
ncbi:MAG: NYN domain-containing protein [Planctomycetota bacterium]